MLIVHVFVEVVPGREEDFRLATVENARNSLLEPGIARFDVVQELSNPSRFLLVEAYRDDLAPTAHKETAHYRTWRETVEPWMAAPRSSTRYGEVHPDATAW